MTEPGAGPASGEAADPAVAARLVDAAITEAGHRGRPDLQARLAADRARLAEPGCLVAVVGEFKKGKGSLVNALVGARVCGTDPVATTTVPTAVRHTPHPHARLAWTDGPGQPAGGSGRQDAGGVDAVGWTTRGAAAPDTAGDDDAAGLAERVAAVHERVQALPARARLMTAGTATEGGPGWAAGAAQRVGEAGQAGAFEPAGAGAAVRAEIGIPRRLLASGLTLLDTPGLAGGLADGRAAETLRAAGGADAVLFVTDSSQELTAPELAMLRRLVRLHPAVLLAVTKTDVYPQWRRVVDTNRAHLSRHRLELPVFTLAAPLRHHALRTGDAGLDVESGYPALAAHLRDEIVGGRRARIAAVAAEAARDVLRQLLAELRTERAALVDPGAEPERRAELDEAEQRARKLAEAAAGWRRVLQDRLEGMAGRLRDDLNGRLRAVESAIETRIAGSDPARDWDDLRRELYRQTNDAMLTHRLVIRSETAAVVDAVTREFDAGSDRVRALIDAAVEKPLAVLSEAKNPEFNRLAGLDLMMHGARGGGIGMLVASALVPVAGAAGIAAATASLVLAPVGLGVVAMLGRRTIASLRENELRAHRAGATKAVKDYLAQAHGIADSDSRATRDQLQRTVRDSLAELAEELVTSARRNREASALAAAESHESRRARLAAVDADIARLLAAARAATRAATTGGPVGTGVAAGPGGPGSAAAPGGPGGRGGPGGAGRALPHGGGAAGGPGTGGWR